MKDRRRPKAALHAWTEADPKTGCWNWGGKTNPRYGRLCFDGRVQYSHRLSYEIYCGPIPKGYHVHHKCKNKLCGNPAHLQALPAGVNKSKTDHSGNRSTLTEDDARTVKFLGKAGFSNKKISEIMGIGKSTVYDILKGRRWSHVNLHRLDVAHYV